MDYLKSSNMEGAKPKLAVSVAQNNSAAAIHSYSTAFYQVSHITLFLNFPTSVSQFFFILQSYLNQSCQMVFKYNTIFFSNL